MSAVFAFAFVAGLLTTLSPCVLPILPFVLSSSTSSGRNAPLLLCLGLMSAFIAVGWGLSVIGLSIGLGGHFLRYVSAAAFLILGSALIFSGLAEKLSGLFGQVVKWANQKVSGLDGQKGSGHFLIGALLGVIWSPCSGPTLGTAALLAAQSEERWKSLMIMTIFAIGAALPVLLIAYGAGHFFRKFQTSILMTAQALKKLMGGVMIALSVLILTGFDKSLEAALTNALPEGWIDLITRY